MKIKARYLIILIALVWQGHAAAQQAGVGGQPGEILAKPAQQAGFIDLLAGLAYTDNALLSGSHRVSDGIAVAGFNLDYQRQGNLSLSLLGNLARLQYLKNSFGGSFYGQFIGSGVLGKPTNLLQWRLTDTFGEEMINPLASPTPVNLQTLNDVATGPLVNLHFGLTNRLTLFGLYSRTTYQRSPFDSQTYQGGATFRHSLPGTSSLALEGSAARTKYIDRAAVRALFGGASAYDIHRASIVYRARFVRTGILLRAGYNTIRIGGARKRGAPLYEVRLSHRVSPFSTVYLDGRQSYSTNGSSLSSPGAQVGLQVGQSFNPGYAVAQPFNRRSAELGWLFNRARTSLSLTGSYRREIFDQTSLTNVNNQREEGVAVMLGRRLRRTLRVQLRAQGYWDHYSRISAKTRREEFELTVSKRFARVMIWFYVERLEQRSASGASSFFASSYNDDRAGVYVTYDLFGERPMSPSLSGMPGMGLRTLMGGGY